jgi:hypothetical protein
MLALFASLWLCATVGLGCYRYYHFDLDFQSHSALHGISGIQVCVVMLTTIHFKFIKVIKHLFLKV